MFQTAHASQFGPRVSHASKDPWTSRVYGDRGLFAGGAQAPRGRTAPPQLRFKALRLVPITNLMSTFRDIALWVAGLLGAVAIYESVGAVGLTAWTVGVLAVSHSRNWSGTFPGDDPTPGERWSADPLCDERADSAHRAGGGHSHGCDPVGTCAHPGCGVSPQESQRSNCSRLARFNAA